MSSLKERWVLGRAAAALRSSDPDLSAKLDMFTRLAAGEEMPRAEHLARRVLVRPLAALVLVVGVIMITAMGYFLQRTPLCTGLPYRLPASSGAGRAAEAATARLWHPRSCQVPPRTPGRPGTDR